MNAVEIDHLSKSYDGSKYALDDISITIPEGEIFGFLGPNGSGKTTTVRLLNGILNPTSGKIRIFGKSPDKDLKEIHSICGVMTETAELYENLTGLENLKFFGNMYELPKDKINERSEYLLKILDLYEAKDKKVKTYSTGMKKKLSFARALINEPKMLFLDEPTSGLDPQASLDVIKMIKDMCKKSGVTVFLCTHQLKYAEDICTYYGFIRNGKLLGCGTFDELLKKQGESIYLEVRGKNIQNDKNSVFRFPIKDEDEAADLIRDIILKNGRVYEAKIVHWSLEDLYFSFERRSKNEEIK